MSRHMLQLRGAIDDVEILQFRIKLQDQTATYAEAARLANVRFLGGYTSFLEVLVTQQQYFSSELSLAQAWNTELQTYVELYTALGGGWL
jgi:outer membrane protein, multidrug efflux system